MEFYWRLKDMPELRAMPRKLRSEWWREAIIGSRTAGDRLLHATALLAVIFATIEGGWHRQWNTFERLIAAAAVAGIVELAFEMLFQQKRARQWLREHLSKDAGAS